MEYGALKCLSHDCDKAHVSAALGVAYLEFILLQNGDLSVRILNLV